MPSRIYLGTVRVVDQSIQSSGHYCTALGIRSWHVYPYDTAVRDAQPTCDLLPHKSYECTNANRINSSGSRTYFWCMNTCGVCDGVGRWEVFGAAAALLSTMISEVCYSRPRWEI